ncbi:MAG TPA: ABC transporter permease subunit [Bryobacteraceae bacterium]|nr:ABC transporter permease subunit [Bryobacteraceae bacterium]
MNSVTAALIRDTFREALARRVFWGLFALSTLMILFILFLLRIDIVEGAVSTVGIFGTSLSRRIWNPERLVNHAHAAVAAFLYTFGMLLALFASATLVPSMLEPGRIELLLSKPLSRPQLILGRYVGNLLVIAANITWLFAGVWVILGWKTHVWHTGFLYAILTTIAAYAVLLAVIVLVAVVWESAALATMIPVALVIMSPILAQRDTMEKLLSSDLSRLIWNVFYYVLPKIYEIGWITRRFTFGQPIQDWMPLWSSAAFGAATLMAGIWIFARRDF